MDGRIRFVYATCGRRYFCIRIKKFADTKISGYVWTGPEIRKNKKKKKNKTGLNLYLSEIGRVPSPQIKSSQRELSITLREFAMIPNF